MGLDWLIDTKAMSDNLAEYNEIKNKLNSNNLMIIELLELKRKLKKISIEPFDYFINELKQSNFISDNESYDVYNIQHKYMSKFIKPEELSDEEFIGWLDVCDPTYFRGKAISHSSILSYDLRCEASKDHNDLETILYADKIDNEIEIFEKTNISLKQILDYNKLHCNESDDLKIELTNSEISNLNDVFDDLMYGRIASRWLRYWGLRGFGYIADY